MKVSVIGFGYVGSVVAAGLADAGHDVIGIDSDHDKIEAFRSGIIPIYEPGLSELVLDNLERGTLRLIHIDEVDEPLEGYFSWVPPLFRWVIEFPQLCPLLWRRFLGHVRSPIGVIFAS